MGFETIEDRKQRRSILREGKNFRHFRYTRDGRTRADLGDEIPKPLLESMVRSGELRWYVEYGYFWTQGKFDGEINFDSPPPDEHIAALRALDQAKQIGAGLAKPKKTASRKKLPPL